MHGAERLFAALAVVLACGAPAAPAYAQLREVVSKEIAVGRSEASLSLEFSGGDKLAVEFRDGSVRLNGEPVGSYQSGDELEASWRALLGEAVALEDGPLALRLRDWSPPTGLSAAQAQLARRVDQAFETALRLAAPASGADATALAAPPGSDPRLAALLARPERLARLARALDDLDRSEFRLHVGEDALIGVGEIARGTVVVVDGDLELRGELDGDVVVVGGALRLAEGGRVSGDVRLSDARIVRDGGEVLGEVVEVRADREQLRSELRRELRREIEIARDDGPSRFSPVRRIARGIGGVITDLLVVLVVGVLGGGLAVHFGREQLEVVAETARRAPLRAGTVGLAGAFLTVPAWILGALALVITIVGILAVPFWLVLFPLAVALAVGVGYLGVAQAVGEWVARQRYSRLEWVRISNPYSTVVAGVGTLMLASVASHVIELVGFLGFVSGLLAATGVLVSLAAALVGLGAVLLTRGGRHAAYAGAAAGERWGDDWDADLGFDPGAPPPRPSGPGQDPAPENASGTDAGPRPEGQGSVP